MRTIKLSHRLARPILKPNKPIKPQTKPQTHLIVVARKPSASIRQALLESQVLRFGPPEHRMICNKLNIQPITITTCSPFHYRRLLQHPKPLQDEHPMCMPQQQQSADQHLVWQVKD